MSTDLAVRLKTFAEQLFDEGRILDSHLVGEAVIELERKPAKVIGTPWTTPLKGDYCLRHDGKSRRVTGARYATSSWMSTDIKYRETPAQDYYPDKVDYVDQNGKSFQVSGSSWATWCRNAVKDGGNYAREKA